MKLFAHIIIELCKRKNGKPVELTGLIRKTAAKEQKYQPKLSKRIIFRNWQIIAVMETGIVILLRVSSKRGIDNLEKI